MYGHSGVTDVCLFFCFSGQAVLGAFGALGARQQHTQALLRQSQRRSSGFGAERDDPIVASLLQHANHRLANLMSVVEPRVDTYNANYYYSMGSAVAGSDADRHGIVFTVFD